MLAPRILYLHSQIAPESSPERFAELLDPKTVGLTDKSQFYAPVRFTVQVCGGINAAAGAIRLDVPVHANPNWLQVMKSRFSGMCGVPNAKSMDFKTITGKSISEFAPEELSQLGKLNVFVDNKLLRLPEMPTVPVEFSVSKSDHIQAWFNEKVAPILPEVIASELSKCASEHEINKAIEPNGQVQKTIEKTIRASLDGKSWTEFVRTHHMNSPSYMSKEFSADTLKVISSEMLFNVRQFVGAASDDIETYLTHLRSKKMSKDPDFAPVLGKVNNNTPKINGQKMFNKLMQDAMSTPMLLHNVVDTLFTQPIGKGCRWDEDKPVVATTTKTTTGWGKNDRKPSSKTKDATSDRFFGEGGQKSIAFDAAYENLTDDQKRKVALVIESLKVYFDAIKNKYPITEKQASVFFSLLKKIITTNNVVFIFATPEEIAQYTTPLEEEQANIQFFDALFACINAETFKSTESNETFIGRLFRFCQILTVKNSFTTVDLSKYELIFARAREVVEHETKGKGEGLLEKVEPTKETEGMWQKGLGLLKRLIKKVSGTTSAIRIAPNGLAEYNLKDETLKAQSQMEANSFLFGGDDERKQTTTNMFEKKLDDLEKQSPGNRKYTEERMDLLIADARSTTDIFDLLKQPGNMAVAVQYLRSIGIPLNTHALPRNIQAAFYNYVQLYLKDLNVVIPQFLPKKIPGNTAPGAEDADVLSPEIYNNAVEDDSLDVSPLKRMEKFTTNKTRNIYQSLVKARGPPRDEVLFKEAFSDLTNKEINPDVLLIIQALDERFALNIEMEYSDDPNELAEIYDLLATGQQTPVTERFMIRFFELFGFKADIATPAKPATVRDEKYTYKTTDGVDLKNVTQARAYIKNNAKDLFDVRQQELAVILSRFKTALDKSVNSATMKEWAVRLGVAFLTTDGRSPPAYKLIEPVTNALLKMYPIKSRIEAHHPWNALIHHSLYPVNGTYPTYYNVLHTKQDMSKDAPYVGGDLNETYKYYHMFMGGAMLPPGKMINQAKIEPVADVVSIESKMRERLVPIAARPPLVHISKIKPTAPVRVAPVRARLVDMVPKRVQSEETEVDKKLHYTQLPSVNDVFDD